MTSTRAVSSCTNPSCTIASNVSHEAQPEIKDPSTEPTADDFLAREKAALGDDADQFATAQDASALDGSGGDLLNESEQVQSTFDSQFPDLAGQTAVSSCRCRTFRQTQLTPDQ